MVVRFSLFALCSQLLNFGKVVEHGTFGYNDADHMDDAPSPNDLGPETPEAGEGTVSFENLDDAGFTTHAFLQAGISVTSKGISNVLRLFLDYFCSPLSRICRHLSCPGWQ